MPEARVYGSYKEPFDANRVFIAVQANDPNLFLLKRNVAFQMCVNFVAVV
jgi:hypothetical protein